MEVHGQGPSAARPRKAEKYGNAIRDYYQYLDGKLAGVVGALDEDTTLIVMWTTVSVRSTRFIHVNNWLMRQGFMQVHGAASRIKRGMFGVGFSPMNVYDTMMRFGLGALKREVVRGQGQGLLKALFLSFEDIDWRRTQAYSLGNVGQIYLNVAGRRPYGCVQPGDEYNRVREEIIARLQTLRDPETNELVVETTTAMREDLYHGDYFEHAPDIVFLPRRLEYFGFGEYEFGSHKIIRSMRRSISGTHRMNGVFMAYGGDPPRRRSGGRASLVDLAPTILHLMGESVPAHMDGRVLAEAIAQGDRAEVRREWRSRGGGCRSGGRRTERRGPQGIGRTAAQLGVCGMTKMTPYTPRNAFTVDLEDWFQGLTSTNPHPERWPSLEKPGCPRHPKIARPPARP